MRDYAELAESLRLCAKYGNAENALANAETAADAIEELLARNDKQKMMIRKQSERTKELFATVPHWISVEERLPDVAEKVLTYNGDFVSENWLCTVASKVGRINVWAYSEGFVTHWMPLPEAPKEVE